MGWGGVGRGGVCRDKGRGTETRGRVSGRIGLGQGRVGG